jgi:cell fate (sporulation/competence/biofilm development) regulator YlbF (YheA/YmcA/DUF963 family)
MLLKLIHQEDTMDFTTHIKNLASQVYKSNEYIAFKEARQGAQKNKEFNKKITNLKNLQFELYQYEQSKKFDPKRKKEMEEHILTILKEAPVSHYLKSEVNLSNMIYDIFNRISKEVENSLK